MNTFKISKNYTPSEVNDMYLWYRQCLIAQDIHENVKY